MSNTGHYTSDEDRKDILLRAAYDLLKKAEQSRYVEQATSITVRYDDANCDGFCLMEDIMFALELEDGTKPIPLEEDN